MIRFYSPEEGFIHPRRFHGQVASGSLPAPVSLETKEQRHRSRGSKESRMSMIFLKHWVTTGKCDAGMSVEKVPAVVNIKTLKGRFIAHKFSTGHGRWGGEEWKKKKSVTGQFAVKYKTETHCWTQN
jgi:hypothetical protein